MANSFDPYIGLIKKMAKPFVPTAKAFAKATSLPKINIKTPTYNKPKALAPVDYTSKEKKSPLFSIKMSRKESPNPKPINLEIPEISKNISQDISNDQLGSMGWGRYNAEPVEKITPIENISYGKYNGAFKDAELKKPEASGILSLRGQEKISETAFDVADNVGTFFDDIINTKVPYQ